MSAQRGASARAADTRLADTSAAASSPEPDLARATDLVLELLAIPGQSCEEQRIADIVEAKLRASGATSSLLRRDTAHRRTPAPGETGNLILKLPGTCRRPRRMLCAHLDTVPICVGCQPVRDGDTVRSADPRTGLGADNRAGVAVTLTAACEVLARGLPHPPLTFCWFVQEEIGLHGARCVDVGWLGKPSLAFNWDGGSPEKLTIGATGACRVEIEVQGVAAHAGVAPERGVSAIAIAGLAIADLHEHGWHGLVQHGRQRGTCNVGIIHGGNATNVVTDHVVLRAEARSHSPAFRRRIVREIERAFARAAQRVRNTAGTRGAVACTARIDYEAFRLSRREPCVVAAEDAVRSVGLTPLRAVANGGLDANWTTRHGIPTVTLGCGQVHPHMMTEALDLAGFRDACRIALRLASDCRSGT